MIVDGAVAMLAVVMEVVVAAVVVAGTWVVVAADWESNKNDSYPLCFSDGNLADFAHCWN